VTLKNWIADVWGNPLAEMNWSFRTGGGPGPNPPSEVYSPVKKLWFAAGTYVGRRFSPTGTLLASKSYTLANASSAPTSQRSPIPGQSGSWFYITKGVWAGYWVKESSRTTFTNPTTPTVETYSPARTLSFAAGTYVGRKFSSTGAIIASKSYTLAKASSAPTTKRATIINQSGKWYYITAGVWAGYWIRESSGTILR